MAITFLEYLDEQYEQECRINKIQENNKEFRYYENIQPLDFTPKNSFLCLKAEKTKILFYQSNVKVYLSDADMINEIVNIGDVGLLILEKITELYNGRSHTFSYRINNQDFIGKGIKYIDQELNFLLHTDNIININEFIFILNMIYEKDRLYSENTGNNFLKFTLSKYILLINHYKLQEEKSREYLKEIDYPVDKDIREVFNSPKKTEQINSLFRNIEQFEKRKIV